jgi:hypothetical protein
MDIKMLEGLSESTLKCMVIDLYSRSRFEYGIQETLIDKISELNKKIISLEHNVEYYKSIIDTFDGHEIIGQWLEQYCETADNILAEDGKTLRAPTTFKHLYDNFAEFCVDIINLKIEQIPDMKTVKQYLKKWQEKSEYGLNYGKRKDQSGINGYEANMLFNLKLI